MSAPMFLSTIYVKIFLSSGQVAQRSLKWRTQKLLKQTIYDKKSFKLSYYLLTPTPNSKRSCCIVYIKKLEQPCPMT